MDFVRCLYCQGRCNKKGFANGVQRYKCAICKRTQQAAYRYLAYNPTVDTQLVALLKEGVGIRGLARVLGISTTTVLRRIRILSRQLVRPTPPLNATYQIDEMRVVVGSKAKAVWLSYALCVETRQVVSFVVGRRNLRNLGAVVARVLLFKPKVVFTDRLDLYRLLIPKWVHSIHRRCTNYIERHHLKLRTQLKRLNRRSIAFSRSLDMLGNCVRLALWQPC
jgi:insertion element IS1 protein InsB